MNRWLTTTLAVLVCSAALRADVTIVQTTTVEGGMASMAASAGAGGNMSPKLTTRVKGMKSRTDIETGGIVVATILDLATKQVVILRPDQKTATIATAVAPPPTPPADKAPSAPEGTAPTVEASFAPSGKSQVIDGIKCDEFVFATKMSMGEMTGRQLPPEAAAAMQGVTVIMEGSVWVAKDAPGAAEYVAFQKAAMSGDMAAAAFSASGVNVPGMEKVMKAMSSLDGLTYLTEMTMKIEGTGQVAEMMKQMGAMKVIGKVRSVTTDAISDDMFKVPEGYTVVKQ
jgi:hypothetical protein